MAIVGFVICTAFAIAAGFLSYKLTDYNLAILGGITGFFLGFFLYSLVFAMFIKTSSIILWIILITCSIGGFFLMLNGRDKVEAYLTAFIGAYLIIRGLSFFLGGYPNEAETFAQLQEGNFKFSGYVYLYFVLFIALIVAGIYVQFKIDPKLNGTAKKLADEEKKRQDNEAALNQDDHFKNMQNKIQ